MVVAEPAKTPRCKPSMDVSDRETYLITSTIYHIEGRLTNSETRAVKGQVYKVPRVGGVSFEVDTGKDTRMILKHKTDELIDRQDLETALTEAGGFRLA